MTHTMLSTVLCLAFAGAAHAQMNPSLAADVPFSFSVSGKPMPSGSYELAQLQRAGTIPHFRLTHIETNKSILFMPLVGRERPVSDQGDARLDFRCAEGPCELVTIWHAPSQAGFTVESSPQSLDRGVLTARVGLQRAAPLRASR